MDNFKDLQNIWQEQKATPRKPAKDLIAMVKRQQRKMLIGLIGSILALLAPVAMMVWIWVDYKAVYPTTKVSLVIIMIAVAGAIIFNSQSVLLLIGRMKDDKSNHEMIDALKRLQKKRHAFSSIGISVYYLLLSTGMALYLAEFVRGNLWFGITAYSLTFGWIAFTWFYLRKRSIAKQNAKLDKMIEHLSQVEDGWAEGNP